jgi:hypothetical protein
MPPCGVYTARPPVEIPGDLAAFWTTLDVDPPRQGPSSWIPDQQVVSCVVENYRTLRFPPPEGNGHVTVIYPIMFSPG